MTIGQLLQERVESSAQEVCIWLQHAGQDDVGISYAALWDGGLQYAHKYVRDGLEPGEVVILIQQHGRDLVYAFWGAIIAGVIPSIMPFLTEKLSPEQYRADLKALLGVTRPAGIVTYPDFEPQVRPALETATSVRTVISTAAVGESRSGSMPVGFRGWGSETDIALIAALKRNHRPPEGSGTIARGGRESAGGVSRRLGAPGRRCNCLLAAPLS